MADFNWDSFLSAFEKNPASLGALLGGIGAMVDPAQPTTSTQSQKVQLPEYIAPYLQRMLQRQEALSNEGYTPYTAPRIADFTQDQQRAFQQMRDMQPMNPMQTQGAGIVGEAANRLMQAGGQRWDQAAAEHYMSPYQQSVTDIQKREAMRDYGAQLPQMAAAAQKAGAFGGSRHGIVQAEAQKNLNEQLQDIQAKGLQSAYTNAQGQFNQDMSRLPTMYGQAGSMGQTLSGIGQTGFQNQLALNQGVMGIGQQQQGLNQKSLDTGYSDFLRQQQHPYDQLKFMQAGLQGLPMTQTSTANFTPAPTFMQQLVGSMAGGAGLAGYMNPQQTTPKA